jgi:hypothetical protein
LISGGRELSREQFSHFRESLVSKVENDGNQEAILEDEDGKIEGVAGNSRNAEGQGAVKSESTSGYIDDPLEGSSSLGSGRNHAKVKRGIRDSIFSRRAKASKSMIDQGEGGIKVLHNPRVSVGQYFERVLCIQKTVSYCRHVFICLCRHRQI